MMGSVASVPLNLILMKRVGDGGYRKKISRACDYSFTNLSLHFPSLN